MKIQIIQILSNGQVTQQVVTTEGAQVVKVQTLPNSKTSFNFEPETGNVSGAEKVKSTRTKQVGNNLILESEGKDLVELVDFYSVPGASVGEVSWSYATPEVVAGAVAPEAQALAVIETGNLVAGIPLGLAVASGVVVIGAANAGGGGSTNSGTTNNTTNPTTPSVTDTTPPTLVITDNVSAVTGTGSVQYTFTFSEAVIGFDATKLAITGGTAGTFTKINDSTYTLMVTPTANTTGNIVVTASTSGVSDLARNAMVQSTGLSASQAYDTSYPADVVVGIPPSLVISDNVSALTATGPVQYTFTFSKGVRGFDVNNVAITGGTAGTFTKVSDSTYTLGVTPTANSADNIVVTAATAGVTDLANTPMVQTTGLSATQAYDTRAIPTDTAAPTVLISDNIAVATASGPVQYTFAFNEAVSGFNISKLNVTGGTAGVLNAVSDQSYTLVVTPTANAVGNISVTLLTNNLSDLSNNPMVQTTGLTSTQAFNTTAAVADTRAPTLTITDNLAAAIVKGPIQYTFTFSEAVSDFDVSKITVAGGSLGQLTALSSTVYQLVVTPANNATGNISVSVAANTVHDLANNALATTTSATVRAFDTTSTLWNVSPLSANVNEDAGNISFVITRTGSGAAATIDFSTGGGNALAGTDYTVVSQNVSFAIGEMSKTIQVPLTNDMATEANETVMASIRNASIGSISTGSATATILDNDQSIWSVVANPTSVDESAGFITYTVSRTGASNLATIDFATVAGTAAGGNDYTAVNQTLSFAVGETSKAVLVAINDDTAVEGDETVTAVITGSSQGDINTASATATVLDNEVTVWSVSSPNSAFSETAGNVLFTVSRTGPLTLGTIDFAVKGVISGLAQPVVEGADFTTTALTLSFAEGEASKTVRVPLVNDNVPEVLKAMSGQIGNASVGVMAISNSIVTIQDDDQSVWQVINAGSAVEGSGAVAFTIIRSGASSNATVDLVLSGSATNGTDYTAPASQTLTFAAGEMTKIVLVNLTNDTTPELNETIMGTLTNVSQGTVIDGVRGVTILDDDSMVWALSSTGAVEGGKLVYVVTRSGDSSTAASIDFATSGGTAAAGIDFTSVANQTLSFAAGETRKTVLVTTTSDTQLEPNETVIGTLTAATAGTITTGSSTATISDDDQSLWSVAANPGIVQENNGYALFTITRTGSLGAATINFNTLGSASTATQTLAAAGLDYIPLNQTLSFAAGETTKTVQVTILDDSLLEQREVVLGTINNPSSGSVANGTSNTNIDDNDTTASFNVTAESSTVEGGTLLIRISRAVSDQAATVDLITTGTGTAIPGVDFVFASQTLSFAPGEVLKMISINTVNDTLAEPSETVSFGLVNPSTGAFIGSPTGSVTLVDNDGLVLWSISAPASSVDEGAGYATFTISRDTATAAATIDVATLGGTAWGGLGNDYGAFRQNLSFAIGEFSKTVRVAIYEDNLLEGNENVVVGLGNASSGSVASATSTLTITDNDLSIWSVGVTASTNFEAAGTGMTFIVSRTGDLSAATIDVATLANTRSFAGVDYTALRQTLNFGVSESSKLVVVPVLDDAKPEAGEGIFLAIANPSSGRIATATASQNLASSDDTRTIFTVAGATSVDDMTTATFTLTRAGDVSGTDTISYSVSGTGAIAGTDFVATNGVATFLPGVRSIFIGVPLIADTLVDTGKSLVMTLQNASSGTITTATATSSLTDNDAPASGANTYAVSATSNNVFESAGTAEFTITRNGDLTIANTSYFRANSGTANNGTDYTAVTSTTLNWAVGETTKVVSVVLQNDALAEVSKTIIGESATNAGFTTSLTNGTLTVLDDDTPGSGTNTYTISQTTPSTIESNGTLAFTISRGGDLTIGSTSYFRTNSGTAATDGSDYTVVNSQTLTWVPSESTKVVFVTLTNNTTSETNETVIGQSTSDAAFTTGSTTVTATVLDDDLWTATAGVADTITYGTASGSYTGAILVDTGDLDDIVSITSNVGLSGFGSMVLGSGNDLLNVNAPANFLNVVTADGGSGVDTLAYSGTTAFNHHTQTVDSNVIGFEIIDLATAATNQTMGLSLADVLEITRGNGVADTLRIMGNAVSGDVLNLQALGKTLATPAAGSSIQDVDGINYTVSASAAGNASANDVTIGGKTYDVYQYAFDSHTINLLVHTTITTNVI